MRVLSPVWSGGADAACSQMPIEDEEETGADGEGKGSPCRLLYTRASSARGERARVRVKERRRGAWCVAFSHSWTLWGWRGDSVAAQAGCCYNSILRIVPPHRGEGGVAQTGHRHKRAQTSGGPSSGVRLIQVLPYGCTVALSWSADSLGSPQW